MNEQELDELATIFRRWTYINTDRKIALRPYQMVPLKAILKSIIEKDGKEYAWYPPRQVGKTTGLSCLVHFVGTYLPQYYPEYSHGIKLFLGGPTQEQVSLILYNLKQMFFSDFTKNILEIWTEISNGKNFLISNGTEIRARTCSINATIEGWTADVVWLEETQDIPDMRIHKSIYPMVSTTGGPKVMIGTPTPEQEGYFNEFCKKGPKEQLFRAKPEEIFPYSAYWKREYEAAKKRLGKNHPIFKTQWEAEWVTISNRFIKTPEELLKLRNGKIIEKENNDCFVGIDVGKLQDSTVVTVIREDGRLLNWLELFGYPFNQQAEEIKTFLDPYNVRAGVIDAFGSGEALSDFLKGIGCEQIVPVKMNDIIKSEMYMDWEIAISQETFMYPDADTEERSRFENQTLNLEKKYKGCTLLVSKPIKRGAQDDYPDSCVRAWYSKKKFAKLDFDPIVRG
jgi:hypothetical protein